MTEKKTILVVDDDIDALEQISMALAPDGYEVLRAESSSEAEDLLLSRKPDLAVFDLMLEDMDAGFVLCHRLKKLYPGTPVVLLTAVTGATGLDFTPQSADEQAWVKADIVMHKPFIPERLRHELQRLLTSRRVVTRTAASGPRVS